MAADKTIEEFLDSGQYEKAYEYLVNSPDAAAQTEEALYLLGITAPTGKISSAYLKEYMQKYPKGAHIEVVRRHLADYYSAQGLSITAGRMYPDLSTIRGSEGLEIYRAGLLKQEVGEYGSAVEYFGFILERGDSELFDWARLGIADCSLLSGKPEASVSQYRALIDESPGSPVAPFALLGISEAYRQLGKLDKAESYYLRYKERFPDSAGAIELEAAFHDSKPDGSSGKIPKALKAGYFVQVGVFSKNDNAKTCLRRFKNLGQQARLESFSENGQHFYRVLIGPFDSEFAARRTKDELEKSQREEFLIFIE